jgi:zinc-ribbon domain
VILCKHCGTELPDHAKFCLQCGSPVEPEEHAEQPAKGPERPLNFVQPAVMGGMFLGILSSIPLVSIGFCMWILLGGAIAAQQVSRQRRSGVTYGDGAFAGVLSGLFGSLVGTTVQMCLRVIASPFFESQQQQLEQLLNQMGVEGPMRDWVLRAASGEISLTTVVFTLFSNLLAFSLFAMIGGILAIALLKKRKRGTEIRK